jgi:hypothetical protein
MSILTLRGEVADASVVEITNELVERNYSRTSALEEHTGRPPHIFNRFETATPLETCIRGA